VDVAGSYLRPTKLKCEILSGKLNSINKTKNKRTEVMEHMGGHGSHRRKSNQEALNLITSTTKIN
jgi:hypothetical protein